MLGTEKYIDELLSLYSRELPATSETAQAIQRGDDLADISQVAEVEGLHYISAGIFMAEEDRFASGADPDISDAIEAKIQEARRHLPDSLIFEAEQEGLED